MIEQVQSKWNKSDVSIRAGVLAMALRDTANQLVAFL